MFVRERLNGYYGVLPYTLANTIASLPFLALIAVACSVVVYYLAGLNSDSDRIAYFMLDLFVCLVTVRRSSPLSANDRIGLSPPCIPTMHQPHVQPSDLESCVCTLRSHVRVR